MPSPGSDATEAVVYTVPQTAKLLQVSVNSLYSLIAQDLVPHVRFGKLIRIPRWALMQHLATASGVPVPANFDVALSAHQSVHVVNQDEEDDDGER